MNKEKQEIKLNLNSEIKFKFANSGKELWDKFYLDLGLEPKYPKIVDGYYITQIWVLFQRFGKYLEIGMEPPIETEIYIKDYEFINKEPQNGK